MSDPPKPARRVSERARRGAFPNLSVNSTLAEHRPQRNVRQRTVERTADARMAQMEDEVVAGKLKIDSLQGKLADSQKECHRLITKVEEMQRQRASQQALVRSYRSTAKRLQSGEALVQAKSEIERLKGEVEEAWNQCRSTEREKRRQAAVLQQSTRELQGELQRKETEAAEAKATSDRSLAHLNAKVNHLERENATLRTQCNRGARFRELDPSIVNSREVSRQNVRLRDSLTAYLDANLEGGSEGALAKAMLTVFFSEHPDMLRRIMIDLGQFSELERETVQSIEEQWTIDICAAMFVHGDLTYAGYQAILNIMSKAYNFDNDQFQEIQLPHGTAMPKLRSKNKLHVHLLSIAEEFGLKSQDDGRAASVDVRIVLTSRLRAIKKMHDRLDLPMPSSVKVQLAADAAGWRKRPSNPMMKNFTAFVVKTLMEMPRIKDTDEESEGGSRDDARVGDSINSVHNNRLALLYASELYQLLAYMHQSYHLIYYGFTYNGPGCYADNNLNAGKESHSLLLQFFSSPHPDQPSILDQLKEMERDGLDIDGHHMQIVWMGGGDLKFQSEQLGLNGHSSNHPCTHCECPKWLLHMTKEDLHARIGIIKRTINRARMLNHKFGPEWELTEPYNCPGCGGHISAEDQKLPLTETRKKEWPGDHYGHYYDTLPILPVEFWDFIPDLLHTLLRQVANMYFVTVSMTLKSQADAEKLSALIEEQFKVKTDPVFNQGTRNATKKQLQTLNGEESWRVMTHIREIISQTYSPGTPQYEKLVAVWESWEELYPSLLITDVPENKWEDLAALVESKAKTWHSKFMQVTGPHDVTPFMHEITVHFGDFIRRVGPLLPYSSEGLEAAHQPLKRIGKYRTNRHGVGAAQAHNTDIMQAMRRHTATEKIKEKVPKGKGAKKKKNTSMRDALSKRLSLLQLPVLVTLGMLDQDDADIEKARLMAAGAEEGQE